MRKYTKNNLFKICELLEAIGLLGNTIVLVIFRNTWTYEESPIWDFSPTPKSSYLTIIQQNPVFAIIYIVCGMLLLLCGTYRLIKRIKK